MLFPIGCLVATPAVLGAISDEDFVTALDRHVRGDWGDVCSEDRRQNDLALKQGMRLFSVYHTKEKTKFWIITEADRSATTVLLPEDY